jgi:hypothetical protein
VRVLPAGDGHPHVHAGHAHRRNVLFDAKHAAPRGGEQGSAEEVGAK